MREIEQEKIDMMRALRFSGKSLKNIAKDLEVSSSTVKKYCSDIELSEVQKKELLKRPNTPINKKGMFSKKRREMGEEAWAEYQREKNRNKVRQYAQRRRDRFGKSYWRRIRAEQKIRLVLYKGGKCEICGYDKCLGALEFHHINTDEKDFNLSKYMSEAAYEKTKKEADKCQLLCSNCHREQHAGEEQFDWK